MPLDIHSGEDGHYFIRSIYFDTITDRAYTEKEAGISDREKIRIRFYNYQTDIIKLERKEKRGNLVHKTSTAISKDIANAMMHNDYSHLPGCSNPLGDYIYGIAHAEGLHPAVVVDYLRTAYVFPVEHVRITFDSLLQAGTPSIPVWMPEGCFDVLGDNAILEMSKYILCRNNLLEIQGNFSGGIQ